MNKLADFLEKMQLPCFFKEHFGYECPGCGMQSAFIELLRGNLYESFLLYPPLLPLLLMMFFFFAHLMFKIKKGELIFHRLFQLTSASVIINFFWKMLA